VSYQGGGKLVIPVHPRVLRKNAPALRYAGGRPIIVHAKLPKGVRDSIVDAAFTAKLEPVLGTTVVGVVAFWDRRWGPKGRAPGRPCGDVDAILAALLDALAGILYRDDAQVGLVVAANAYDRDRPRVEVVARPLRPETLAALGTSTGLPFAAAAPGLALPPAQETLIR
jgi:hypothetical protein